MSSALQFKSQDFKANNQTWCIGTLQLDGFIPLYRVGLFLKQPDGSYEGYLEVIDYANPGDCLKDMQAKGGRVKYLQWLFAKIETVLAKVFNNTTPVVEAEPETDQQAKNIINAAMSNLKISIVDGVITVG